MFALALSWLVFIIIPFIISSIFQILLYKIGFKKYRNNFEEIDTKRLTLWAIFIVYFLPIPMSFLFAPVERVIIIRATFIKNYETVSWFIAILPYVICFFILFYFCWKKLILKNSENTNFKIAFVFCLAFLPFVLIAIFMLLTNILSWIYLFW